MNQRVGLWIAKSRNVSGLPQQPYCRVQGASVAAIPANLLKLLVCSKIVFRITQLAAERDDNGRVLLELGIPVCFGGMSPGEQISRSAQVA